MTTRTILYNADGRDEEIELGAAIGERLDDSKLLWVDLSDAATPEAQHLLKTFAIDAGALSANGKKRPALRQFDDYFCVHALNIGLQRQPLVTEPVTFLVGSNFVITIHPASVRMFDDFASQNAGETRLGEMNSATFFATLLDWLLARYFSATELLEDSIDELDMLALGADFDRDFLGKLSKIRQQVSALRRSLVAHRDVFHALARPDFAKVAGIAAPPHLKLLADRFERAVDAVENTRDLVMGSYELFATGVSQQTNETMRRLTFFTVLLGILAVTAGVLGMNFQAAIFNTGDTGFIVGLVAMGAFSAAAIIFGRHRGWL
jgi:Mg2+ and Co2+ transporter CorA